MFKWGRKKFDRISERWPKQENGDLVPPVLFQHIQGSELDVEMTVNLLEAFGIPALRKASCDGTLGEVLLGASGFGVDIFVPENMLEDAQNVASADIVEEDAE